LFRVPEPIRIADKKSRNLIKEFEKRKNIFDIDIFIESINDE
jgi:hypothetical protein